MEVETLALRDALERWCDAALVEKVRAEERKLLAYELDQTSYFQLTPRTERRQPTATSWMVDTSYVSLAAAWRDLEQDLRRRIASKQIYVQGIQAKPSRGLHPEPIPGGWAADFKFDFGNGTITVDDLRYTAIVCSLEPFPAPPAAAHAEVKQSQLLTAQGASADGTASPVWTPKPEEVGQFSDDLILALLEEHARRVAEGPDAKLIAANKVSLLPIIKRKLHIRAERQELLEPMSAEMSWLAEWIMEKAPSHHTPKAGSIENSLREEYRRAKASSKRMIP